MTYTMHQPVEVVSVMGSPDESSAVPEQQGEGARGE
jgi:hypothetical protein